MINYLLKIADIEPKKIGITANEKSTLLALANRSDRRMENVFHLMKD